MISKKLLDDLILRKEMEDIAKKSLEDAYASHIKKYNPPLFYTFEEFKEKLLIHYIVKDMEADNVKGAGI